MERIVKINILEVPKSIKPLLKEVPMEIHNDIGRQHVLYNYVAKLFKNSVILDIGTRHGASAVSLKSDTNVVYTIDCRAWKDRLDFEKIGIRALIVDIAHIDEKLLKSASLIVLDVAHDGMMEIMFYRRLKQIDYKGILILDDIHLQKYGDMEGFWQKIDLPKYDLTLVGHCTGTGMVDFSGQLQVIYHGII